MKRKTHEYEAEGIVVEYEVARCIHAAECVRTLPAVFDANARPWIQPDKASVDAVADAVQQCPTGALSYRRTDGGTDEEPPAENTVRLIPNGPLYLSGRLRFELPDGEARQETRAALCRCGGSKNKPFCDNAHQELDFTDPGTVVEHRLRPESAESDGALEVKLAPNGPIILAGPLEVVPADGAAADGGRASLCRCGASKAKPYCDGSHAAIGFAAD